MTVCSMTRSKVKVKVTSPWKSKFRPFSKTIFSPIYNGGWQIILCHVTLKLASSRSRPSVPYGANLFAVTVWLGKNSWNLLSYSISLCSYPTYIKLNMSVCLFFVPYARLQFWAHLHEIKWHVATLYLTVGHERGGGISECWPLELTGSHSAWPNWQAQRIDLWKHVRFVGNSELAVNNHSGIARVEL